MPSLVRPIIVRWMKDGKRVTKRTKGAVKVTELAAKWYGQGIPGLPPSRRVPLAVDKAAAQRKLDNLVRNAERGQAGIPTNVNVLISDYLTQFEADAALGLAARGSKTRRPKPERLRSVMTMLKAMSEGIPWVTVEDVNTGERKLAQYLASRVGKPRAQGGLSHQSAQFYLAAARRFAWYLSKQGAAVRSDVFDSIPGYDAKNHRLHARREISAVELGKLLTAAKLGPWNRGLPGPGRFYLYLAAFSTGFRAGELAVLKPENFDLYSLPPMVSLPGEHTKNRKAVRQPLPPAVAVELRAWVEKVKPGQVIWPGSWRHEPGKMLQRDLSAAGIPYTIDTPDGKKYADFHALRHSFVSALARTAGIGAKELQELARHSDPRLTLSVYAHARPDELGTAVAKLELPLQKQSSLPTDAEVAAIFLGIIRVILGKN